MLAIYHWDFAKLDLFANLVAIVVVKGNASRL
jgi:hypothetical protein